MSSHLLRVGTSGFSYSDWRDVFYPPSIKSNEMFGFYCQHFNTLELNVTYYKIPALKMFERLAAQCPDDFDIVVKVPGQTTHVRDALPGKLTSLIENSKPLNDSGHLAGFLAQFPYSFHNEQKNRSYLAALAEQLRDFSIYVEFRHDSWDRPAVQQFLHSINLGYVNVDEPPLKGLLPCQDWVTSANGYVRFHGRNKDGWWTGQGSERYRYEYELDELKTWLSRLKGLEARAGKTYLFFNNHPRGGAPINAQQLRELLQK